jgi:transcriptional regulator with XRE-family HTH domain
MRYAVSMKSSYQVAAFPTGRSATTLALLVDKSQKIEIGLRIKELRDNSAETGRTIADYCGVSVEAVRNWIAGKGISYENAEKVAELFGRDVDYVWRGREKGKKAKPIGSPFEVAPTTEDLPDAVSAAVEALRIELVATRTQLLARIEKAQKAQEAQLRKLAPPSSRKKSNRS